MTLNNYWWLLLWMGVAGGALLVREPQRVEVIQGHAQRRWSWTSAILVAAPYVLWATNRTWFGDTEVYRQGFLAISSDWSQLPVYMAAQSKDMGFSLLAFFLKQLLGSQDILYFFGIAAFQMFCVVFFFRKYSPHFLWCFFMFVASTDYLSWMFNGMRQFLAVCITLLCFGLVVKKRYVWAVMVICLASTIHGSALMMLPIIFVAQGEAWNKRTLWTIAAVVVAVLFVDQFTSLLGGALEGTQYSDILSDEIWTTDDGTNLLRVLFYSIPAIMAWVGREHIRRAKDPVLNLCVNYAVITALIYVLSSATSGIYVGRLPIYTTFPGYVAAAWLLDEMFTEESTHIAKVLMAVVYLAFFYYQMHVTWGIL